MPQVLDITRSSTPKNTPGKKTPGKPKPPPGPPPPLIIGVSAAVVVSILFLVWFFAMRPSADSRMIPAYPPPSRNLSGTNGGGTAMTPPTGNKVAPGLPGDGG